MADIRKVKIEPSSAFWGDSNGDGALDLGCTDGDMELSLDETLTDITCHQGGTQIQGQLRTGKNVEISLVLKETDTAQMQRMIEVAGGKIETAKAEVSEVTAVADVAGSLDSTYFTMYSAGDAEKIYVWADVDAGGNDPAPTGYDRGISYAVTTGDDADTVAGALASALTSDADFSASSSGSKATVTHAATGPATDASDVDSGFSFEVTTQGAAAVSGWGQGNSFQNTFDDAQRLVLHPVNRAASDKSEDYTIWKAYPKLDTITLSGENPRTMSVTFMAYPDPSQDRDIDILAYGDATATS